MRERLVDVMLFLLGQTPDPTREDWLGAIDDLFGELDESEKQRLAEAGMALVSTHARPAAPLRLVHANPAAAQTKPAAPNQPAATPKRLAAEGGRAARLEAVA
ncbi:hypothetical protein [Methylobacterium durans]|nr:hypothetical protein [Methylobacterium durans]